MARSRNIKPGFFTNDKLVEEPFEHRLLFVGLWTIADKAGRLEDRPKKIKMCVFPADDVDIEKGIDALTKAGFLIRYEVSGLPFIQIVNWDKHQSPHHTERESEIPECKETSNGDLTGKEPKSNASACVEIPLIPDSLIPDSLSTQANACRENPSGCPPCPIEEIISIYHETLPTLPKQRVRTAARDEQIRARWKQFFSEGDFKDKEGGLDCFRWFFTEKVKASRFLMGQTQTNGRKPFVADLEWVTKQANFAKIIEGRYSNGA